MASNKEAKTLLISMARYIHSKYDHEINHNSNNLALVLKKTVEKHDDKVLNEYWAEYLLLNKPSKSPENNDDSFTTEHAEDPEKNLTPTLSFGANIKKRLQEYKQERKERGK